MSGYRWLRAALRSGRKRWGRRGRTPAHEDPIGARDAGAARTPTFGDLVDGRRAWLFEHLPAASAELHHDLFDKSRQKRLARRLGLLVAEDHLRNVPLDEALRHVETAGLDRFVVKPDSSRNAIGCRCVVREGRRYRDLRSGKGYRGLAGLRRDVLREYGRLDRRDDWILEELLMPADGSSGLVDDVKLYCFAGVVELIGQKRITVSGRRARKRIRWYTRDWEPVDVGAFREWVDPALAPPPNAARLVEVAEDATSRLCCPFLRLDLYDTTRGIVLGEFTPGPGARRAFSPEWDERLCRRWREAEARLERGIRSGEITPLLPEGVGEPESLAPA